ncbi:MAG: type II secretion system F family protein [Coriobacteriia bacterium]|nr:type II secretion system F family protein [Coriobacteriia bacterium]MCL2536753.1 type II secretion system F family protein [Coriobacteriia bacterium]
MLESSFTSELVRWGFFIAALVLFSLTATLLANALLLALRRAQKRHTLTRRLHERVDDASTSQNEDSLFRRALAPQMALAQQLNRFSWGKRILRLMERAGLGDRVEPCLQWWLLSMLAMSTVLLLVMHFSVLALSGALLFCIMTLVYLQSLADKRKQLLRAGLPDMLDELAQSLRAGRSLPQSYRLVSEAQGPESAVVDVLRRLDANAQLGRCAARGLSKLSELRDVRELKSIASVIEISSRVGGSTPALFEQSATTIRQDLMLNNKLLVQTAQGRSSVRLVGAVPFVLIGFMSLLMPGYLLAWLSTRGGQLLFALALVLIALGFFWVRSIVNIKV